MTNPHDKLFRETWSNLDNARSFLHHYLPGHVLACMDLETLEISKDSFVEKELSDYYSDMLYKVTLSAKPGFVYVLFEHKSYYDKYVHLQLLEYMVKIWRLHGLIVREYFKGQSGLQWKEQGPSEFLLQHHGRIITDVAKYAMSGILAESGDSRL